MKARIFGAGSIGNHLSYALKSQKFDLEVIDIDSEALDRMKNSIYPSRYGSWDSSINLLTKPSDEIVDLEIIGTPPDTHAKILKDRIHKKSSRLWMVEKPFTFPDAEICAELSELISTTKSHVYCGYNHSLSPAFQTLIEFLKKDSNIRLIDSYWLEHWGGIFKAHPWLEGPSSSYLGYSRRGGGAFMEHSHGIHLALALSNIKHLQGQFSFPKLLSNNSFFDVTNSYDQSTQALLQNEDGSIIRYTTDVLSENIEKSLKVETSDTIYRLAFATNKGNFDSLKVISNGKETYINYPRTRKDDFLHEIKVLKDCLIKNDFSALRIIDWRLALHICKIGIEILT